MRTVVISLALVACSKQPAPTSPTQPVDPVAYQAVGAEVKAAMDFSADACSDFYQYACGGWLANTELPGDKTSYTRSFSVIYDGNELNLKALLASAKGSSDPKAAQVGAFYASCMDEAAIEAKGAAPMADDLARVDAIHDLKGVWPVLGAMGLDGHDLFFSTWVEQDAKNPDLMLLQLGQGGLSLPDRDYYLLEEKAELRTGYQAHIAKMFVLAGDDEATAATRAKQVIEVETALAEIALPKAELRDPDKTYHRLDRAGIKPLGSHLDWDAWLTAMGHAELDGINVQTPEYFEQLDALLVATPLDALKSYLRWQVVHGAAGALPKAFVDESFAFFGQQLYGQKDQTVRWKRCVRATDQALGDPLGEMFVNKYFAGESKVVAKQMVTDIETAFKGGLPELAWMDDTTRARAVEKVDAIHNKIGYPDVWRDYSSVAVGADHYANALAAKRFTVGYYIDQVGKQPNPNEWYMTPPTVNAYYDATKNEIVFPAGILQAPFFDANFPAAMNYGAIGMVIGHEITHGFDDGGRKFDKTGQLKEWWEPEVSERFEERASCVEKQYSGFEVREGLNVNGKLTLGENIADLGGIKQALSAYRAWEGRNGAPGQVAGLSGEQLLFVAYAQGWCSIQTPEAIEMRVRSDSHSPPKFRVNGALRNLPDFAEAFGCEQGTPMRPADACEVW